MPLRRSGCASAVVVAHSRSQFPQHQRRATIVAISVLRNVTELWAPHASQRSGRRRNSRFQGVVSTQVRLQDGYL